MKQAAEYRQHGAECRELARTAKGEQERRQLLDMTAAWERMATEREQRIEREARLSGQQPQSESLVRSNAPVPRTRADPPS